jgi:hypothetical protein
MSCFVILRYITLCYVTSCSLMFVTVVTPGLLVNFLSVPVC